MTPSDLAEAVERLAAAGHEAPAGGPAGLRCAARRAVGRPGAGRGTGRGVGVRMEGQRLVKRDPLGFRFGETIDTSINHGRWPFFDKDTRR